MKIFEKIRNVGAHFKQTFRVGRELALLRSDLREFLSRDLVTPDVVRADILASIASGADVRGYATDLLSMLAPMSVVGIAKIRVGRDYDGGYVMLDHGLDGVVAYSCGICEDVSWDLQIAERGTEIHQYDHTIDGLPETHARFHWQKRGICGNGNREPGLATLSDLMRENGHVGRRDLLLKMDIEGAEWDALTSLTNAELSSFSQIVLELHGLSKIFRNDWRAKVLTGVRHLNETHQVVHLHANNHSVVRLLDGVAMPDCVEVTCVRRTDHRFELCSDVFPTELDMPCNRDRGDIFLGALGMLANAKRENI